METHPEEGEADVGHYLSPASFWLPEGLTDSPWLQHVPFAFWLADRLRPRIVVGLEAGDAAAHLAFCQALRRLGRDSLLFAVHPRDVEPLAGPDPRYGDFARVLRAAPTEAAAHFADGTVDLLHIDGRFSLAEARALFEAWRPRLSDRAAVLVHGTAARGAGADLWILWAELAARYPAFEFMHGEGLGLLGVGSDLPAAVAAFFAGCAAQSGAIRESYLRLGGAVMDRAALLKAEHGRATAVARSPALPAAAVPASAAPLHVHLAAMAPLFLDVRTRLPLAGLGELPGVTVSLSEKRVELPRLPPEQPKVLVLQRAAMGDLDRWRGVVAEVERRGWVLVCELDDHPDLFAAVHRRPVDATAWRSPTLCHAVQTSTPAMAEALRAHNPHVAVFPNCAFTLRRGPKIPAPDGRVRVFYGALNRENFSRQVGAALAPFAAAHPEVEFTVIHDRAFFDALGPCAKAFHPAQTYEGYLRLMGECDVALMPLEGAPGERYKSDVKWVEASALGLATVASPVVYAATIRDGVDGLIAAETADWPHHLASLVGQQGMRAAIAGAAHGEVVARRTFATQAHQRIAWYRSLWDRRVEIAAEARNRRASLV